AAAIVELDALTNTVWPAAENDDLLAIGRTRFVFDQTVERGFVGRIHVSGWRSEFGSRGVDALVGWANSELVTELADVASLGASKFCKASVREAHALKGAQVCSVGRQTKFANLVFHVDDAAHLLKEPRVDLADFVDFFVRHAIAHGFRH